MVEAGIPPERLYLHKERNNDVFVDKNDMHEHQIDGLRFLFKQFKKKNPGVILNFPSHSGKSATIVLFLYSVRKLLKQPVLVLCRDSRDVDSWKECFEKWSGFTFDEIVVEPTKALIKKQIFIKSMSDLVSFTRRSWSILVYKDDDFDQMPLFTGVDFYIWATSTDLMKDVGLLTSIYKWMCPKEKISFDGGRDLKKRVLLDAQLENIVLRKSRISSPEIQVETTDYCISPKKSKKNKDATGKKIKRSKISKDVNCNAPKSDQKSVNELINDESRMDLEIFISNENPVTSKDQDEFDIKFGNLQYDSNDSFILEANEIKVLNDASQSNNKEVDNCNILKSTIDVVDPMKLDTISIESQSNMSNDILKYSNSEINDDLKLDIEIKESLDMDNDSETILKYSNTDINNVASNTNVSEANENVNEMATPNTSPKDATNIDTNTQEILFDYLPVPNENYIIQSNAIDVDIHINNGAQNSQSININAKTIDDSIEENFQDTSVDETKTDLDIKISEMEEKALKKFKGSFLDSIF